MDEDKVKWDGTTILLEDFDKRIARWCRKKNGTALGNMFWGNELPDLSNLHGNQWDDYTALVWDAINDVNSTQAKHLYPVSSGFYDKVWHHSWIKKQYDRMYDHVEAMTTGAAALEVQSLGMSKAPELRAHLHRQFGGAGDDVRAREERYSEGLPKSKGQPAFPKGVDIEAKLRELQAERIALWRMCTPSMRNDYEFGKETTLVKITLKLLRGTEFQEAIDKLLQEIKMERNFAAKLPVMNLTTGLFELPVAVAAAVVLDDWDYRNYNDSWLPSWKELKSKLISAYKLTKFVKESSSSETKGANQLPVMMVPGLGCSPKVQCFGCGQMIGLIVPQRNSETGLEKA